MAGRGRTVARNLRQELDVVINNAGMASAGISEVFTPEQAAICSMSMCSESNRSYAQRCPLLRAKRAGLVINMRSICSRVTLPFFGALW